MAKTKRRDHYEVLGVARTATADELKRAYRKLSKQFHPDRNPGDPTAEMKFKEVQHAYSVLSDPKKRQQYDQYGDVAVGEWQTRPTGERVYQWGDGSQVRSEDLEDLFSAFGGGGAGESIFEQIFGGVRGRRGAGPRAARTERPAPADEVHAVTLTFDQAVHGTTLELKVDRGRRGAETLHVKIPPGVEDGQKIRVRGQGAQGNGGPSGNIILVVRVLPHPYFQRKGADIYLDVPITASEAALGARIDVSTIRGRGTVTVPPGTASGAKLRLRGQGVVKRGTSELGDQYVIIQIVPPRDLTDEGKKLFEKLREFEENPRRKAPWAQGDGR